MANPKLSPEQDLKLFQPLLAQVCAIVEAAAATDEELHWALRHKLAKKLTQHERNRPQFRKKLKRRMHKIQSGNCAICEQPMPIAYSELDRSEARGGYTESNVRLVHRNCHIADQQRKGYTDANKVP